MKTAHLDMRPIYVRKEKSTRGHVFVVMLALLLQRELECCWAELDITVDEGLDEFGAIALHEIRLGDTRLQDIPIPNKIGDQLLKKANIHLPVPSVLPSRQATVAMGRVFRERQSKDVVLVSCVLCSELIIRFKRHCGRKAGGG